GVGWAPTTGPWTTERPAPRGGPFRVWPLGRRGSAGGGETHHRSGQPSRRGEGRGNGRAEVHDLAPRVDQGVAGGRLRRLGSEGLRSHGQTDDRGAALARRRAEELGVTEGEHPSPLGDQR